MPLEALRDLCASDRFTEPRSAHDELRRVCDRASDIAQFEQIGDSEEGRPIVAVKLGAGETKVSLIAGNHSDEPVGPEFLRRFVPAALEHADAIRPVLERYTFVIVPHTNPDGEAKNWSWIRQWPDLDAYLRDAFREAPGRDLEFGFPEMRAENELVSSYLRRHRPYALHASLHGMGFAEGGMLLIERRWGFRTEHLQRHFAQALDDVDIPTHDHNRKGEKGFFYLGPGFSTTPEGTAMRCYFRSMGDDDTAELFQESSMEFVRSLSGDPLCIVTEIPLFVLSRSEDGQPGVPSRYLAFRERLPELRLRATKGEDLSDVKQAFGLRAFPLSQALEVQLKTLEAALQQLSRNE